MPSFSSRSPGTCYATVSFVYLRVRVSTASSHYLDKKLADSESSGSHLSGCSGRQWKGESL